jgi:hypothetical protein
VLITDIIIEAIKTGVGWPRPGFYWLCFLNGLPVSSPLLLWICCFFLDKSSTLNLVVFSQDYNLAPDKPSARRHQGQASQVATIHVSNVLL